MQDKAGQKTGQKSGQDADRPEEPDLATRLSGEHHQSLKLWLRMLSCTVRIENEIRSRLRASFEITLPRFDLMAQLERHPEGLRMGELSRRMMVTSGNVTGITDQLEREGLVARMADPQDRRAYAVKLTRAGQEAFATMASVHAGWVEELLGHVPARDKDRLLQLLGTMKAGLDERGGA